MTRGLTPLPEAAEATCPASSSVVPSGVRADWLSLATPTSGPAPLGAQSRAAKRYLVFSKKVYTLWLFD
jgi:hypothetical protein